MPEIEVGVTTGRFYRLLGCVVARHARILLLVLAVVLMATGCGDGGSGDDGGGGY